VLAADVLCCPPPLTLLDDNATRWGWVSAPTPIDAGDRTSPDGTQVRIAFGGPDHELASFRRSDIAADAWRVATMSAQSRALRG